MSKDHLIVASSSVDDEGRDEIWGAAAPADDDDGEVINPDFYEGGEYERCHSDSELYNDQAIRLSC